MPYSFAKNASFLVEEGSLSSFPTTRTEEKAQQVFPLQMYQRLLKDGLFELEALGVGDISEESEPKIDPLDQALFRIMTVFSFEGQMVYGCFGGRLPLGFLTRRFQKVIQPALKNLYEFRKLAPEDEIQKEICFGQEKWIFWSLPNSDLVVVGEIGERSKAKHFSLLAQAHLTMFQQSAGF